MELKVALQYVSSDPSIRGASDAALVLSFLLDFLLLPLQPFIIHLNLCNTKD